MASRKSSALTVLTGAQLLDTHVLDVLTPEESADVDKNKTTTIGALRETLGQEVSFTGTLAADAEEVTVTFATAFATVPEFAWVRGYQPTAESIVNVTVKPGSVTTTQLVVIADDTEHNGIKFYGQAKE